jgi:hypothetical protein
MQPHRGGPPVWFWDWCHTVLFVSGQLLDTVFHQTDTDIVNLAYDWLSVRSIV